LEGDLTMSAPVSGYVDSCHPLNSRLDILQYWKNPGPFNRAGLVKSNINTDRFLAFLSVIVLAAYSYGSVELVAM